MAEPISDAVEEPGIGGLDSFRRHLICPTCNNLLRQPVTLPCLCSFCRECLIRDHAEQRQRRQEARELEAERQAHGASEDDEGDEQLVEGDLEDYHTIPSTQGSVAESITSHRNPDLFSCPLQNCDGSTTIPLDDIGQLQNLEINMPLCNIEDTLKLKVDLPEGRVQCGACGIEDAIGVCNNKACRNRPYCGKCLEFHLRDKMNEEHCIVYPDPQRIEGICRNLEDVKVDWEKLQQSDMFCFDEDHRQRKYLRNIYCADHDEVICERCTALDTHHGSCRRRYSTEDVYQEYTRMTKKKIEAVEELHEVFKGAMATTEALKRALEMKVESIKESIHAKYEELEKQLQNERDNLLRQTGRLLELKTKELNDHLEMLERVSQTFTRCTNWVTDFMFTAIPSEFMILKTQINHRLEELTTRYSHYHLPPIENDCIFFERNGNFNMTNSIGRVYSTPSVRNFRIQSLSNDLVAHQPLYFSVITRDIIRTDLIAQSPLPKLCATIRHLDEDQVLEGFVYFDRKNHKYCVSVLPNRSGRHELCIYKPMDPPYDRCLVGGKRFIINVDSARSFPFEFFFPAP